MTLHLLVVGPNINLPMEIDKRKQLIPEEPGIYSQHIIFFMTYEWAFKLEHNITIGWKSLTG
jgi:hypothetical protein